MDHGRGGLVGVLAGVAVAVALAVGVVGYAAGHYTNRTRTITVTVPSTGSASSGSQAVSRQVAAGAFAFAQFGCGQCHGPDGKGGISSAVPVLTRVGKTLTVAQLTSIINHGLGASANPKRVYMPVWGAVISPQQVRGLVAYIRGGLPVVPGAAAVAVPVGEGPAVAGAALYVRYGCINCHGPNGLGGVPNPAAPDKVVPPLSGAKFRKQFNTDAKILSVIRSGSVIGHAPIVSMPHWGGIISNGHLRDLVAYLKTLSAR